MTPPQSLNSGMLSAWALTPRTAQIEGRDPRFLTIILRGGLDGLAAVAPVGDPDWVALRGREAPSGEASGHSLDGFFELHAAMPSLHRLYQNGHATIVHAIASPYRARSHFDAQNVLESGFAKPGHIHSGWLNRALAALEPGEAAEARGIEALTVGPPTTPLVVRGVAPVLSWAPARLSPAPEATTAHILALYREIQPDFAQAIEARLRLAALTEAEVAKTKMEGYGPAVRAIGTPQVRAYFAGAAASAARIMARPDGPRVGALTFDGWDTHTNQGSLAWLLNALDGAIEAIAHNMSDVWRQTVVAVITEFGRTVQINGCAGTDHGTGTAVLLVGGALKGGRVVTDWPGLKEADLLERRDLRPTTDLRALLKGLLKDHLQVPERALDEVVFPDSHAIRPIANLIG